MPMEAVHLLANRPHMAAQRFRMMLRTQKRSRFRGGVERIATLWIEKNGLGRGPAFGARAGKFSGLSSILGGRNAPIFPTRTIICEYSGRNRFPTAPLFPGRVPLTQRGGADAHTSKILCDFAAFRPRVS